MGIWKKNQMVGRQSGKTVFEITKENEVPSGKLARGASFIQVFKTGKKKWSFKTPKKLTPIGFLRFSAPKKKFKPASMSSGSFSGKSRRVR